MPNIPHELIIGTPAEKISDNGVGIHQKVIDKIFHHFFTTKTTGQGTGLGLSLAYDIITKGHNGVPIAFRNESGNPVCRSDSAGRERSPPVGRGEGCEFIIQLPVK